MNVKAYQSRSIIGFSLIACAASIGMALAATAEQASHCYFTGGCDVQFPGPEGSMQTYNGECTPHPLGEEGDYYCACKIWTVWGFAYPMDEDCQST